MFVIQKVVDSTAENGGEGGEKRDIRIALLPLPF